MRRRSPCGCELVRGVRARLERGVHAVAVLDTDEAQRDRWHASSSLAPANTTPQHASTACFCARARRAFRVALAFSNSRSTHPTRVELEATASRSWLVSSCRAQSFRAFGDPQTRAVAALGSWPSQSSSLSSSDSIGVAKRTGKRRCTAAFTEGPVLGASPTCSSSSRSMLLVGVVPSSVPQAATCRRLAVFVVIGGDERLVLRAAVEAEAGSRTCSAQTCSRRRSWRSCSCSADTGASPLSAPA
jgi:hypothetical protein